MTNKDEQIESLYKQMWWKDMKYKARESYLENQIRILKEELATIKANQNDFGDK
jgi:ATP-dependent Lon protease